MLSIELNGNNKTLFQVHYSLGRCRISWM